MRSLCVGDVVLLEAGDAVPADGRIIENASLKIEEAALTGESVPVSKFIDIINLVDGEGDVPLGDRQQYGLHGQLPSFTAAAQSIVAATGMNTEMGKIADALAQAEDGQTPSADRSSRSCAKILTWLVLGICVVIFRRAASCVPAE